MVRHYGGARHSASRDAALLAEEGDVAGATSAYRDALDSDDPDMAPEGAFSLAVLRQREGYLAGAVEAYHEAIMRGSRAASA